MRTLCARAILSRAAALALPLALIVAPGLAQAGAGEREYTLDIPGTQGAGGLGGLHSRPWEIPAPVRHELQGPAGLLLERVATARGLGAPARYFGHPTQAASGESSGSSFGSPAALGLLAGLTAVAGLGVGAARRVDDGYS